MTRSGSWRGPALALLLALACSRAHAPEKLLRQLPLDSLDEVLTKSGVALDPAVSSDGHGSLRIDATGPVTVHLAEVEGLTLDDAQLLYRARLRTDRLDGHAYLEMWCAFPGKGEFFSRGLGSALTGTNDWTSQETPFLLRSGETPRVVKLNLVVEGKGTVWLDQVELAEAPL